MSKERITKVNELIKEELGKIILKEFDPANDVLITLTRVDTSKDLLHSKVYVSVFPESNSKTVLKDLEKQIYFLQQKLNNKLKMKPVPKIRFVEEKETVKAGRIEEILEKLKKTQK